MQGQKGLEEQGFRYLNPQNYIFPSYPLTLPKCDFQPNVATTKHLGPVYLNSANQVSHPTTVFQIAFSWRVSVSNYCSPDILGSLPPI